MDEGGKIPWTVPVILVLGIMSYVQRGPSDPVFMIAMVFVAIRIGFFVRATIDTRRARAGGGAGATTGTTTEREATAGDNAHQTPRRPDEAKEAVTSNKRGKAGRGDRKDWQRSPRS